MKLIVLLILAFATPLAADVIHLKSGSVLEGDLKRSGEDWRIVLDNGTEMEIPANQVVKVELQPRSFDGDRGEALAMSRLDSLRKSVENAADPQQVIDRYTSFIERHADTPAAEAAREQQREWERRLADGLVKLGPNWVTPEEKDQMRDEATADAAEARQLVKLGRVHDARPLLDKALEVDPRNVTALYISALLAYRGDALTDARRALESVEQQLRDHAPTLNNLAIIAWRQNRTLDALALYERAMAATPMNQLILSNVAEALRALPENQQSHALAKRVYRLFTEQDQKLQEQLAADGVYRWGAQYLSREQFEQVQAQQTKIQAQLDGMASQFEEVEQRIKQIDIDGEGNDRTLRQLEAGSYHRTPEGRLIRLPLPPVYRQIQQENDLLKARRREAVAELERLRVAAADLQKQMPQPQFTGVQNIVGVEGTPLTPPPAPADADNAAPPAPVRDVSIGPATRPAD